MNKTIKFGERIRFVRKKAKVSQKEFCEMLDIPQSTLSAYETDRMQPTIAALVSISEKCGVSMDWLCGTNAVNNDTSSYIDTSEVCDNIIRCRKQCKMSQTDLAKALGKSIRTIQKYEKGEIDLTITTLCQIADALHTSAAELLGLETPEMLLRLMKKYIWFGG